MRKLKDIPRSWIIIGGISFVVGSFLFSPSFRNTILRYREIKRAERELAAVTRDIENAENKIRNLENSGSYELLVRSDLGYLRPGEKEVRFVKK